MELNEYGAAGAEAAYRLLLVYRQRHEDRIPWDAAVMPSSVYGMEDLAALLADLRLLCVQGETDWSEASEVADGLFAEGVTA